MLKNIDSVSDLPSVPAVYAMFGGKGRSLFVAYVGIGKDLRGRVEQHLIRRDSSVSTGASVVSLNPDLVTEVRWWEHGDFVERDALEAAELIAFEVLDPALKSRGSVPDRAKRLYADQQFREEIGRLLDGEPTGRLVIPSLRDALDRIRELEGKFAAVEKRLDELDGAT